MPSNFCLLLIKDGWRITADPYFIIYKKLRLVADLGAERTLSAQKGDEQIVVEVKSFILESLVGMSFVKLL